MQAWLAWSMPVSSPLKFTIKIIILGHRWRSGGASVAMWLAHLPFTCKAVGSSLSENFLNATRTQSSCEKS